MSTQQLEHHEIHNEIHQFPICIICDNITSAENVGMIFRVAEAMGVSKIYLCGDTPKANHRKVHKTARSTEKYVPHTSCTSTVEAITQLKAEGYTIAALEITNNSLALHQAELAQYPKIALILGNEQHGVAAQALECVDLSLAIKMFGQNTSINVVNSLAIALYEITKQLHV